jgi:hypothetical protein
MAVCGDLAAEHRALLQHLDHASLPAPTPEVAGPGVIVDEGQFESIATTLATTLAGHPPSFETVAPTQLVDRRSPLPPTMAAPVTMSTAGATPPSFWSMTRLTIAALVGLGIGLGTSWFVWPAPTLAIVDMPLPDVEATPRYDATHDATHDTVATPAEVVIHDDTAASTRTTSTGAAPIMASPPTTTKTTRRSGFDAETTRALASLRDCVEKVPCARGVLEWSGRPGISSTERVELKDAVLACMKRCRLK